MKKLILFLAIIPFIVVGQTKDTLQYLPYLTTLKKYGREPMEFIRESLSKYQLLIFDDALHTAYDPFEFYNQIIKDSAISSKIQYVFLEVICSNKQKYIDAYLNATIEDSSLLFPAFQDDYSTGLRYKTYFDLFHTIYEVNKTRDKNKKIKVIGVAFPIYWASMTCRRDIEEFQKFLFNYDYHMYQTIINTMNNFETGDKGIFLTNTRHAYKGIKNKKGVFYWNCGTFLSQWHAGKTYSIRIHNVILIVEAKKEIQEGSYTSTEGMEKFQYYFGRIAKGLWDYALKKYANYPVALEINNTPFGNEKYIGNHMLNVQNNMKMADAYDALIFLKPLENMKQTAMINFIYTPEFIKELERRYKLLYSEEKIAQQMKTLKVQNINELIRKSYKPTEVITLPQILQLKSIEEWKQ